MILDKEGYADSNVYKKGDTFTPTSNAVYAGYVAGSSAIRVSIPLDKPIAASGVTVTLNQTELGLTTTGGICRITNPSVHTRTLDGGCVSFNIQGTFSIALTQYTPIAMGLDATITFT